MFLAMANLAIWGHQANSYLGAPASAGLMYYIA